MRDTELYQTLLGLTTPWEVSGVAITQASAERPLGEVSVTVQWRADAALVCPACGRSGPRYDSRLRRWRHLNTMQWKTFIAAEVPRVNCPQCGVKQVRVAWAEDASRFTELFEAFAIQVLQAVRSKVQAQGLTELSWDQVDRIMERAVARGLARRSLEGLSYLGLDEKSFGKGHDYVSVLHDVVGRRVLDLVPERTREAADTLWAAIPEAQRQAVAAVAADMWQPYLEATRAAVPQAAIVHDKFHCAKELNKAVDLVRRREHRALKPEGDEPLSRTKYLLAQEPGQLDRAPARALSFAQARLAQGRPCLGDQGGVCRPLGLSLRCLGQEVLRPLVLLGHALAPRADHRRRQNLEAPSHRLARLHQAPHYQRGRRNNQRDHPAYQGQCPRLPQLHAVPYRDPLPLREARSLSDRLRHHDRIAYPHKNLKTEKNRRCVMKYICLGYIEDEYFDGSTA